MAKKEESYGERLRRLRLASKFASPKSLTVALQAAGLTIKPQSIQHWEGDRAEPRRVQRPYLARVLGVSEMVIEFGEAAVHREALKPATKRQARLLEAYAKLTPDQQAELIEEIESTVQSNMEIARQLSKHLPPPSR